MLLAFTSLHTLYTLTENNFPACIRPIHSARQQFSSTLPRLANASIISAHQILCLKFIIKIIIKLFSQRTEERQKKGRNEILASLKLLLFFVLSPVLTFMTLKSKDKFVLFFAFPFSSSRSFTERVLSYAFG
jgi:hypothetical protein